MSETTNLFSACARAGYNGRNSASFVGKIVTFCLLSGTTNDDTDKALSVLSSSAFVGRLYDRQLTTIMELCPLLGQVITDSQNLSTVGQLRGKEVGFETVFHAVIDFKVKH